MKTKSEIAAAIYTILTTLLRGKATMLGGVPNGHLYVQLPVEIEQWNKLIGAMKHSGLVTETNYLLRITSKGEKMLTDLDAIYQEAKKEKIGV